MACDPLKDRFAQSMGMQIVARRDEYAKVQMTPLPEHLNGADIVHGGVIFSLADYAFALAANTASHTGLSIQASIHFVKAVYAGTLTAEACRVDSGNSKTGSYEVKVQDADGNITAVYQGLAWFKKPQV